jgi:ABC-type dipeptide/oligopeptide/nickel transport system permease subunit
MSRLPILLALASFMLLIAPLIAPANPMQTNTSEQLQPPSTQHPLGTDLLGRDVFSRLLWGGQRTLVIATLATLTAILPGTLVGVLTGSAPRWLDAAISAFVNAALAFPGLVVALIVLTLLGQGALPLALATGAAGIAPVIRVTRGAVIGVRSADYIEAAQPLGASPLRVTCSHVLPNITHTLAAYTGALFAYSLLNSAALSFLGLSGEPGVPDWGVMLAEGREILRSAPWVAIASGLAITLTVIGFNRMADRVTARQRG